MNLYVWFNLEDVTDRYHAWAGVVVIAESLDAAHALNHCTQQSAPDFTCPCEADEPKVFIFPNAGCC